MDDQHKYLSVFCEHCGMTLRVPDYCQNRFCSVCSHHRNRLIRHKIDTLITKIDLRKFDSFKFLTLTIRNDPDVNKMTTELITAFRRLRQRSLWKKHVRGGCTVIEVKPGKEGWHVHLHIIIESGYIPFDLLLSEWKAVSTGQGVFIKKLHSLQVLHYLTKYLTQEKFSLLEQIESSKYLKGRRLFQPFGSWFQIINRIPKMTFPCPTCGKVHWFFGDRKTWYGTMALETLDFGRIHDRKPALTGCGQQSLIPDLDHTSTIFD